MVFLFDENIPPRLPKGMQVLDEDNDLDRPLVNKFYHITEFKGRGIGDPDIVREAKRLKAIIISEDNDYKNIDSTYEVVIKSKVGYVWFKLPRKTGCTYNEIVGAFVRAWPELKKKIADEKPPYMFVIERSGDVTKYEKFRRGNRR